MSSSICPLCQQTNLCTSNHACWCMTENIPKELVKQAQDKGISAQCICQNCILKFKQKDTSSKP